MLSRVAPIMKQDLQDKIYGNDILVLLPIHPSNQNSQEEKCLHV